jgi:hypothetical protein
MRIFCIFVEHVLDPREVVTYKYSSSLHHDPSVLIKKCEFQKTINGLIHSSFAHSFSDAFYGLVAQKVVSSQTSCVSDLILGFFCETIKIVNINIFFYKFSVPLILSVYPEYFWKSLLQRHCFFLIE